MHTRTKIVCTIGPSTSSYEKILELMQSGMNVARLNFSHGSHKEHLQTIKHLKKARSELGIPCAIMLDTHGPKIRVRGLADGKLKLKPGEVLELVKKQTKNPKELFLDPPEVIDALSEGIQVLFDDGYIISKVVEKRKDRALIEIENYGELKEGKGVNIPGADIPLPALTDADIEDIRFGCKHDIDIIAASYIRSAHHVLTIKQLLARENKSHILVIAKIESTQGIENFDSIVQVSDGIMVARGDLGVEIDLALVPKYQKRMIKKCYQACKPVVTATQMLESMITNPRPTRAEVSDVANAIYDSTSLVMLSGETAVGKYPIETVQRMREIVLEAEKDFDYAGFFRENSQKNYHDVSSAVSLAAVKTAFSANAKCIFAFTTSGQTARLVSRLRPPLPIIAVTPSKIAYHQLSFNWGVVPILAEGCKNIDEAFKKASQFALSHNLIEFGDVVVVTAGAPFGQEGSTNMMIVENIGEVLVRGLKGFGEKISAPVVFVLSPVSIDPDSLEGKIAVIPHCDNSFLPILKKASGVILQNYLGDTGSEKYVTLVAKTYAIPVISRADGAMSILKEGDVVHLDPQKGLVYREQPNP